MAKIEADNYVILVLHSPREKFWGVLREIGSSGIFIRCVDLGSFEEFMRAVHSGETFYGLGEQFFPMWRVERISLDEADGDIPALYAQLEERSGRMLSEF